MSGDSAAGDRGCDEGQWADFDDSGKRVVPVLRVSTSLDALHSGLRRAGVTDSGENLSAATLRRLACDAEIIPTVLNGKDASSTWAGAPGGSARRCAASSSPVTAAACGPAAMLPRLAATTHTSSTGQRRLTNADNLTLLCHRHHILLHEGRHRLKRVDDAWVVLKPDGTRLHKPLAAAPGDIGSGHLRADDPPPPARQPDSGAFSDLATAASTKTTAATRAAEGT